MKNLLHKLIPEKIFLAYHWLMAISASVLFQFPSRKMVIIGITGTKGKTTSANYLWSILEASGLKAGLIGTANIRMGSEERLNSFHMTMPGPFILERLLRNMANKGITHAIVETTSEGIKLHRDIGIAYDILIFTNLFPEHLPSHGGSFENYKKAKGSIFAKLKKQARKIIDGKPMPKVIIANADSEHSSYFLSFEAGKKMTFSARGSDAGIQASDIKESGEGVSFSADGRRFETKILGAFNAENALSAIAAAKALHIPMEAIIRGIKNLSSIPGRMEVISEGQNFTAIVDYAHEKESMGKALSAGRKLAGENRKLIVLLGAEGGGRDKAKRPAMGALAGKMADFAVISNVDPYDDDPLQIINDIKKSAEEAGKKLGQDLFAIPDRREGIRKALSLAEEKDVVIIACKGSEQTMILGKKKIKWDDRLVVREEIRNLLERKKLS